jgi:hypothetical protein
MYVTTQSMKHIFTWFTPTLGLRPPNLLFYYCWPIGYKHRASKPTLHRTGDLCSSLNPHSPSSSKPKTFLQSLHSTLPILALISASISHRSALITKPLLKCPKKCPFLHSLKFYLYITKRGLNMGKPMGRHPSPVTLSPKSHKGPKKGVCFHDLCFALCSIFDRLSKSQKWSNMTK